MNPTLKLWFWIELSELNSPRWLETPVYQGSCKPNTSTNSYDKKLYHHILGVFEAIDKFQCSSQFSPPLLRMAILKLPPRCLSTCSTRHVCTYRGRWRFRGPFFTPPYPFKAQGEAWHSKHSWGLAARLHSLERLQTRPSIIRWRAGRIGMRKRRRKKNKKRTKRKDAKWR